jgi:hypothetical protein
MPFRWLHDVSAASWIADRLHPFCQDTGSVVPSGFDRYLRLFHPVLVDGGGTERWSDIAERNGRIVHPEMQLHMINRPVGTSAPTNYEPGRGFSSGSLPPAERAVLIEHLRPATTTPDACWFAVWEGFGALDDQGVADRIVLPSRSYLLASGSVYDVMLSALDDPWDQSANLWWPADLAWIVATEVDYAWTYVGGSATLIEGLCADARLEALPAQLSDKPFYDSDLLNAALDG